MPYLLAFVFGATVGSFLNVCIWRLPLGESIVYPSSHCPSCGTRIRHRDNIPVLGYVLLGGRCHSCGSHISLRYPAVELLTGFSATLLLYHFGLSVTLATYGLFVGALIVITFIDIDHQIIPDVISLPGVVLGLIFSVFGYAVPLWDSVVGAALGGGLLYLVAVAYRAWAGREGMGGGDIKLLAMIGAFLGWQGVLVTLILGSFTGAVIGIALIVARGADSRLPIPFGPFLALGAVCTLFFGDALIHWYWQIGFSA
jgi:leader peptidase (prepilin peptidase) / N-methyltransferase